MKKKRIIYIIISIVIALSIIIGVLCLFRNGNDGNNKKASPEVQSETSSKIVFDELDDNENAETDEKKITDNGAGLSPDESKADKVLESKKKEIKKAKQTVNTPIKTNEKAKDKKYVQDANPETGISWDGVSKIIYRTIDGDTTKRTYGGYYEIRPDEWVLYEYPTEYEEYDNKCSYCGRVSGDGTHGTCIRYSLIDEDMRCPNCGKTIPAKTCHTCEGG